MDKQKADRLISEYLPKVYGFSISKCYGYDEAEDLCADIIVELYRSMLSADEIYNLDGYVWRISMNVYARFVSQKKRHEGISIDGMDIWFYDEYSFEGEDELIPQLRLEIAFLTKVRRQIVYAYYFENKTVATIATEMNIPVGTVKWHLSQSRNELKEGFK
ncbi:MAG: RNA polymerase sigma factor, partial [Lachnospiraceae bacterium]|nr:RNA polymerase sigma factor [Lachnospiraceae bacterium]